MLRATLLLCLTAAPAAAQAVASLVPDKFEDRWTERVPVSGRTLVGLISTSGAQAAVSGWTLPGSIALPAALAGSGPVCIRVTTQDGRYYAENSFSSNGVPPADGRAGVSWPTGRGNELKAFSSQEVAAIARSGSCAGSSELIPVILDQSPGLRILQALVNTRGGAITAVLRDPDPAPGAPRTLRRVNCVRVQGMARVAFDARCTLGDVAGLPERVQLRLDQVSRDGLQIEPLEMLTLRLPK